MTSSVLPPNRPRPAAKNLVLATCCLSLLIVSMDVTIVNVALPSIRADLHTSVSRLQWTVDGYTLAVASFLLTAGAAADRFGRRRVFQIGLVAFSLGSLLCSLAPSVGTLIGARVVQGLGGSMLNPVAMSIITNTITDRRERARAVGVWGAVVGVSMALGPLVGGALTEWVSWRSIFWVNVPIGVAAIVLTAVFVPESRAGHVRRADPFGQGLVIIALVAVVFGLIEAPSRGWASPLIIGLFALAVVAIALLIRHAGRVEQPFIDLRFFRSAPFSSAALIAVLGFASYGAFLFVNALYLQDVRHLSALRTGEFMLPLAITTLICSLASGRLVGQFGTRPSLMIAGGMLALSGFSLTFLRSDTRSRYIIVSYVLFGIGFGMINAPITTTAVSGMPLSQAGVAAGVASTSRQTGSSIGVALAGTVTGVGAASSLGPTFASGTHPLWWIVVGAGLAIAVLGVISTGAWAKASAARVGRLFDQPTSAPAPAGRAAGPS